MIFKNIDTLVRITTDFLNQPAVSKSQCETQAQTLQQSAEPILILFQDTLPSARDNTARIALEMLNEIMDDYDQISNFANPLAHATDSPNNVVDESLLARIQIIKGILIRAQHIFSRHISGQEAAQSGH